MKVTTIFVALGLAGFSIAAVLPEARSIRIEIENDISTETYQGEYQDELWNQDDYGVFVTGRCDTGAKMCVVSDGKFRHYYGCNTGHCSHMGACNYNPHTHHTDCPP